MKKETFIAFYLGLPVIFVFLITSLANAQTPFKPYYISLTSNEVNMRTGPGYRYPIAWQYQREHMPFQVIDSFDHWRQVKDYKGTIGWVHKKLISLKRTGIVIREKAILRERATLDSEALAEIESGVVLFIEQCKKKWCYITMPEGQYEGWLYQNELWGDLS